MNLPTLHSSVTGVAALNGQHAGMGQFSNPSGAQTGSAGMSAERKMELMEYWRSITKRKWAIGALTVAVAGLAAVVSMAVQPVFKASATVLIESGKGKSVAVEEVYSLGQQREHFQTQIELLKSREVALRSARVLRLWDHENYDPRLVKPSWTSRFMVDIGLSDAATPKSSWSEEELAEATVDAIREGLSVTPVRLSQLARVEFESTNAELAAKVANTVAAQYIKSDRDERYAVTTQVSQQLQGRLGSLRQAVEKSERALQEYREKKGLVSLSGSTQANMSQQVGGLTERLLAARARRIEWEGQTEQIRSLGAGGYGSVPVVIRDAGVIDAQRTASAASAKLVDLKTRLGPEHERVQQAEAEVADATAALRQRQKAVADSVLREFEAARSTEVALERTVSSARDQAQGQNRDEFQLGVLEYQSNRQLFDLFMTRAKETNAIGEIQPSVARITDPAVTPTVAIKPNRQRILVICAALALLLGMLAAVAIDRLDNTIKGTEDAEMRLRSPVLAALPEIDGATRKGMARAFLQDGHSHFSEGIRTARTGIMLSGLDAPNKILLVTSSVPGEGKTTVAVNLAFAHSQSATRTLLIDCDMRRGQASRMVGLGAAKVGLASLVAGRATVAECIRPVKRTELFVLPVGETPPNPLELLLSQKFKDTLAALSKEFPIIIIDSPPVELVSEALVLAPLATNVAVVVRAMSTPAPLVRKTQLRLQRAGGHLLGVIINGLNFKEARAYYGEYVHSSYSYTYDAKTEEKSAGTLRSVFRGKMPWARETQHDAMETQVGKAA